MPRCFVERCSTFGRKKFSSLNIVLHVFPNRLDKIKSWLRCIEKSGQVIGDVDEMAERIFAGKRYDKFRICSEHFTEQSYIPFGLRKTLKKDAIPTIFRDIPSEDLSEQKLKPPCKRTRTDSSVPNASQGDGERTNSLQPNSLDLIDISPLLIPGHHQGDPANIDSTNQSAEYFQQPSPDTKEKSSTEKDRSKITQRILNLTLEIISLLTGEDCIVVKKSGERVTASIAHQVSEGLSRTQKPIVIPPLIDGKISDKKILELTFKIIQLLTGEVPIRCEDATVYFCMDKVENLEKHKHLNKDAMMENHQSLRSPDMLVNRLGEYTSTLVKEESVLREEENLTDTDISTHSDHTPSPSTHIKEESISFKEVQVADTDLYSSPHHTQYTPTHIKEESESCEEENLTDTDIYTPTDHIEYTSIHIKEESISDEEGNLTDTDDYSPTDHIEYTSIHIKEESISDEEENLTDTDMYTLRDRRHYAPNYVDEETDSCDEGNITDTEIYTPHPSTHTEHPPKMYENHLQKDFLGFDEGNSIDTDVCALIKHAQTKYTFAPIEEGSASDEGESVVDSNIYASKDHTQYKSTPVVEESVSSEEGNVSHAKKDTSYKCSECSETFVRRSDFANHRRDHRRERLTCPECGKLFSNKPSLINHLTGHTGEKPYSCPICGKCFTRNSNLIVHQAIHMERSPLGARNAGDVLYVKQIL
ncbi:uncharacterized protein LOC142160097 [Mixophyes fleayi]|uniref:uncharacterized protein LOC142160097 n=1 Tax=Mixophyes fleayi TaxID=3061075 RepID=UPI003F4DDA03